MASNGFFEFLGNLKDLSDDSSYYGKWANQYNPFGGRNVNNFYRGLSTIWSMMDRNAADRARKAQQQEYKANTEDTPPTNVGIGVDANGFHGMGDMDSILSAKPAVSISAGSYGDSIGAMPPQNDKSFSSIFGGNSFKGGSLVNPSIPSVSSGDSLAQGTEGNASARDLSRYLSNDYNIANWMQADVGRGVDNPYISALRYATKIAPLVQAAKEDRLKNLFMTSSNPDLSDEERKQARIQLAGELNKTDLLGDLDYANWQRQKAKEEFEHGKSMWDLNRIAKELQIESAKESINDKREGKRLKLNAQKLQTLFGDGKIYNIPLNETMEDTGLKNTNPEVVTGLNLLNTYARKLFNTDLSVNGGWRSEEHQRRLYKEQGKEPFMGSLHLKGQAADVDVSNLSDAQRNELVDFAEQLGFHTTYHDIGNGIHLHVELGNGRHIADVNSLLTKNGIPTGKNKNDSSTNRPPYDVDSSAVTLAQKFRENPDDKEVQSAFVNSLVDYYKQQEKEFGNSEQAKWFINQYIRELVNMGVKKGEELPESYVRLIAGNIIARANGTNTTGDKGKKNPADLKNYKGNTASAEMKEIDKLTKDQDDRDREAEYYFDGEKVSKDFYDTMMKMGANREKNKRKREEEEKQSRDYWKENFGERRYID